MSATRGELVGREGLQLEIVGVLVDQRLQPRRLVEHAPFGLEQRWIAAFSLGDVGLEPDHPVGRRLGVVLHVVGHGRADDHGAEKDEVEDTAHRSVAPRCERGKLGHADRRGVEAAGGGGGPPGGAQLGRAGARIGPRLGAPGATAPLARSTKVGVGDARSGAWREPPLRTAERSARKRLTMRSSSEWKETTTSRPPSPRMRSEAASASASSSSSRLTKMRSAWKVRVAGWMGSVGRRPIAPGDDVGEFDRCRRGAARPAPADRRGHRPRPLLLAEDGDHPGKRRRFQRVDDVGGASARMRPCACRAARPSGRRSRAPASSICMDETPMSRTTPSTRSWPCARAIPSRSEKRPSTSVRRPPARRLSGAPAIDRAAVAVDGDDRAAAIEDCPAYSRRRRRCRR